MTWISKNLFQWQSNSLVWTEESRNEKTADLRKIIGQTVGKTHFWSTLFKSKFKWIKKRSYTIVGLIQAKQKEMVFFY